MNATIPKTMRAIEITTPGEPDVLKPAERPTPAAARGEVLIQVLAAGVNRPDCLQRRGRYPVPPGASDIPGLEVAGRIVALGEGVRRPGRWRGSSASRRSWRSGRGCRRPGPRW